MKKHICILLSEKDEMLLRQSFSMGSSNHTIEINKEGNKNDISMLSDSLPLQSSSSSKSTTDNNNNGSNVNVAALQIQSSSSNSSQKLSVSSKDNNSLNGHSASNHSTSNHSTTNSTNYMDRPPRVRTSSNGSNITNSNPGSANNSPKQRSPKPPLSCVTDSNGGIGQFPSSPLGKFIDMRAICVTIFKLLIWFGWV